MRVLICGDRDYENRRCVEDYIDTLSPDDIVINGRAKGADRFADEWAHAATLVVYSFPAQWDRYGKAAGPIRNQRMLDEGKPDLVVYFHDDIENSRGTKDMVRRAQKVGVPVLANPKEPK